MSAWRTSLRRPVYVFRTKVANILPGEAILAAGREEVQALGRVEEARLAEELHACATQALTRMVGTVDDGALRLVLQRVLAKKAG